MGKKENKCFKCNATSKESVLLKAELEGADIFVCAQCLPMIIHGG
ncbi:MAG TPA: hypothetical protein VI977_06365 [archaeon]|nr:hypothetical protein [archaeon]